MSNLWTGSILWSVVFLFFSVLPGCSLNPDQRLDKVIESQFKLKRVPASCTKRKEYPQIVAKCRVQACQSIDKAHCAGGLDDKAAALWLSCVKEEMNLLGADHDDCRLFTYDLNAALNPAAAKKKARPVDPFDATN